MIVIRWLLILTLAGLVGVGCRKRIEPAPPAPRKPRQAETHTLRLLKVQFGKADFSRTSLGQPLDVRITLREDGTDLPATSGSPLLSGRRGERVLDTPLEWSVTFDRRKAYQIVLTEQAPPGESGKRTFIPATPQPGFWPFGENHGHITFGAESFLEFSDTVTP